jgi:hypothetical protein
VELPASRARVIGYVLGLGVFALPLGAAFCSIWWGWKVPGRELPQEDTPPPGGPLRIGAQREGPGGVRVVMRNASGGKLRLVVPGGLGRVLRLVPAGPVPFTLPGKPSEAVYDEKLDAVVELLPGDSYSRVLTGEIPGDRFRAVYDSRGAGLPEGAWSGRAVSGTVR